jgi:hypothetical protein
MKTSQIDNLSPVTRLLTWMGISLATILVIVLLESLSSRSFGWFRWTLVVGWVVVGTAAGYVGSEIRNRNRQTK